MGSDKTEVFALPSLKSGASPIDRSNLLAIAP